jgi:membrane protein implicated in regulation of membrane protease activity
LVVNIDMELLKRMESNLLALLAFVVAVYSMLSAEKKLDIQLRFSFRSYIFLLLILSCVLYMVFLPVLVSLDLIVPLPWFPGFNPQLASFSYIVVAFLFLLYKSKSCRLPKAKYKRWLEQTTKLLHEQKFEILSAIFDRYSSQIIREITKPSKRIKIINWLNYKKTTGYEALLLRVEQGHKINDVKSEISRFDSFKNGFLSFFASILSKKVSRVRFLTESISKLLKSKAFVNYLIINNPMLCARFMSVRFNGADEYTTNALSKLIEDKSSILYREIKDNQNCSYTGEYTLDESSQFINYFFTDLKLVSSISMWKPIGDSTINYIKDQKGPTNFYNLPYQYRYYDEGKWQCQIFMSVTFFEIMVSRAIFERHTDHMFLMYLEYFARDIVANYEPSNEVNLEIEYPTHFDYLMYEILDTLCRWSESAAYLDLATVTNSEKARAYPEWWACRTLGQTLRLIMLSNKFSIRQHVYYLTKLVRTLKTLDQKDKRLYSKTALMGFLEEDEHSRVDANALQKLSNAYANIDHVLRDPDSTIGKTLKEFNLLQKQGGL